MVEIYDKKSRFYSIKLTIMAIVPLCANYKRSDCVCSTCKSIQNGIIFHLLEALCWDMQPISNMISSQSTLTMTFWLEFACKL